MLHFRTLILLTVLFFCTAGLVHADAEANDGEAMIALQKAQVFENEKDYSAAAKKYLAVELYSEDPVVQTNALLAAARNYRLASQYGDELDALLRLVNEHVNRINFQQVITRMFQIGDAFFDGHKDLAVKWLPFIYGKNRMEDAYTAAIKHAPSAPEAPKALLRLAMIHKEDNKLTEAVEELRAIMEIHPESDAARYAYVELAALYCLLAEKGDGDGAWAKQAVEQLNSFIAKYPNDPEIPWAKQKRAYVDTLIAKRLCNLAEFYHREGKDDVAKTYLTQVIRDYGTTENAIPAEKLLAEIDSTYVPPGPGAPREKNPVIQLKRNTIPLEDSRIIEVPENSNGRFLLPVYDVKKNNARDSRDALPESVVSDEDI